MRLQTIAADKGAAVAVINHSSTSIMQSTVPKSAVIMLEEESGVDAPELIIENTIIKNNASELFYTVEGTVPVSVNFSNIQGGFEGDGNLDLDPIFCDSGSGDFSLAINSPCIGSGKGGLNIGAYGQGCDALISQVFLQGPSDTLEATVTVTYL